MILDDPANYEAALRRLIELRFQAEASGRVDPEAERLEAAIYRMIRSRPNPMPNQIDEPDDLEFVA